MTRYMYWLKHIPETAHVTEMEAADHLETLRREQKGYLRAPALKRFLLMVKMQLCAIIFPQEKQIQKSKKKAFIL